MFILVSLKKTWLRLVFLIWELYKSQQDKIRIKRFEIINSKIYYYV